MNNTWHRSWFIGVSDEYLVAIGQLVVIDSHVELSLQGVLIRYSRASIESAFALFPKKITFEYMIDCLKRILSKIKDDDPSCLELRKLLPELQKLHDFRNEVAHHQWGMGKNGPIRSKLVNHSNISQAPRVEITLDELRGKCDEYAKAMFKLQAHMVSWEDMNIVTAQTHGLFPPGNSSR